jgi:hypothetical protein
MRQRSKVGFLRVGGADRVRSVLYETRNNFAEAAKVLGVDRSTVHRWCVDDPSLKAPLLDETEVVEEECARAVNLEPADWAQSIRALYALSSTEETLLDLARRALEIARDPEARPADQLAAMGRFQRLVIQLNLEKPLGKVEEPSRPRFTVVR